MANTTWSTTDKTAGVTLTGGNLIATASIGGGVRAIDRQITGKFYWEVTCNTATSTYGVGFANLWATLASVYGTPTNAVIVYTNNGAIWLNGVNTGTTIGAMSSGTAVCCMAVDLAAQRFWARVGAAGNWNGNAANNPATGVGGIGFATVGGGGLPIYPAACYGAANAVTANFGDTAFTGAVPAGFTSGFTAGATVNTNMVATQTVMEQWGSGVPEMWATQVLIEHWASVADATVVPGGGGDAVRVMVMA